MAKAQDSTPEEQGPNPNIQAPKNEWVTAGFDPKKSGNAKIKVVIIPKDSGKSGFEKGVVPKDK